MSYLTPLPSAADPRFASQRRRGRWIVFGTLLVVLGALFLRQGPIGIVLLVLGINLLVRARRSSLLDALAGPIPGQSRGRLLPRAFTPVDRAPILFGTFCAACGGANDPRSDRCRRCGAGASHFVTQRFQDVTCRQCGSPQTLPVDHYCKGCGSPTATRE